jgi:hypothetical protein
MFPMLFPEMEAREVEHLAVLLAAQACRIVEEGLKDSRKLTTISPVHLCNCAAIYPYSLSAFWLELEQLPEQLDFPSRMQSPI